MLGGNSLWWRTGLVDRASDKIEYGSGLGAGPPQRQGSPDPGRRLSAALLSLRISAQGPPIRAAQPRERRALLPRPWAYATLGGFKVGGILHPLIDQAYAASWRGAPLSGKTELAPIQPSSADVTCDHDRRSRAGGAMAAAYRRIRQVRWLSGTRTFWAAAAMTRSGI